MLIRPPERTIGVNVRPTPNFLNSTEGGQVAQFPGTGNGNSPPTRKWAVSPELAVRLGSANVRTMPARSIARTVAPMRGAVSPVRGLVVTGGLYPVTKLGFGAPDALNALTLLKLTTVAP